MGNGIRQHTPKQSRHLMGYELRDPARVITCDLMIEFVLISRSQFSSHQSE